MPYVYVIDTGGMEPNTGSSVTIILPYNPADIPGGYTESDLTGTYFDGTSWVTLSTTVDTVNDVIMIVTDHFSWWGLVVSIHTPTPVTAVPGTKPVLYPNPANGDQVKVALPSLASPGEVRVQVFTLAYRKVQDVTLPNVQPGTPVTLDLLDKWGVKLSNGLYYLVVRIGQERQVVKLLVAR
jgi:hypothetical protein